MGESVREAMENRLDSRTGALAKPCGNIVTWPLRLVVHRHLVDDAAL